jgi:hypothetical protein
MRGQTLGCVAPSFLLMWLAMMVMMLPSALPTSLKNKATMSLPLLHGVWIFRHLAGSRFWDLCGRSGVCGRCDAVGII